MPPAMQPGAMRHGLLDELDRWKFKLTRKAFAQQMNASGSSSSGANAANRAGLRKDMAVKSASGQKFPAAKTEIRFDGVQVRPLRAHQRMADAPIVGLARDAIQPVAARPRDTRRGFPPVQLPRVPPSPCPRMRAAWAAGRFSSSGCMTCSSRISNFRWRNWPSASKTCIGVVPEVRENDEASSLPKQRIAFAQGIRNAGCGRRRHFFESR